MALFISFFSFLLVCFTFFLHFLMFLSNLSLSLFLIIYSALYLCLIFLAHYNLKGKVKPVRLPCCLSPLINCEPICTVSWNSAVRSCLDAIISNAIN
jgi:hypothetical protein